MFLINLSSIGFKAFQAIVQALRAFIADSFMLFEKLSRGKELPTPFVFTSDCKFRKEVDDVSGETFKLDF
jgi:hypothetical protein